MQNIPHLPRPRRRELIRIGRKSGDPATALRFLMIAKLSSGASRNRVAHEVGTAVSTVITAAQRFARHGIDGLYDQRRFNGARKVDEIFQQHVGAALCGVPQDFGWERPTWTRELLCLEMERRSFPRVAVCTMGRVLAAICARLGRPKPVVLCPWPAEQRDARLAEITAVVDGATRREPVFYADEVDLHLNPKIGLDWMLRGACSARSSRPVRTRNAISLVRSTPRPERSFGSSAVANAASSSASCSGASSLRTALLAGYTSCSTTSSSTRASSPVAASRRSAVASCFTSSRRTVPTTIASSASGSICTPTSRAIIAAQR